MKMRCFDENLIRIYMDETSVLEQGMRYMKHLNPSISDEVAKERAIVFAIEQCESIWMRYSTGYISNERLAFSVFLKDVSEKRYFYDDAMDAADQKDD